MNRSFLCLAIVVVCLTNGTVPAQDYLGDFVCGVCHSEKYDDYMLSGHPFKLNWAYGGEPAPDTWPATPVPPLPEGTEWNDVEYVIGNYYWKTRFVDRDGFIITGDAVQWNLETQDFVPYHSGEVKPYDCGRCHTTGYDPEGNQFGLEGLVGTWAQPGVRCEACHGPGSDHVASFGTTPPPGGKDCSECHYRDSAFRMPWKGGFMRHHQQGEDLSHSPHAELSCNDCHNPHRSVVYGLGGTISQCGDCHLGDATNNNYVVKGMESVECIDCHMPMMGKSAVATNEFTGDIRGHLFEIMTEPIAAADNVYEDGGGTFWNQDASGNAAITLDYACLGCHSQFDPSFTLADAAAFADGIHNQQPPSSTDGDWRLDMPFLFAQLTIGFEDFAGFLLVSATETGGETSSGIGMEFGDMIFWMDMSGALFYGNLDHSTGTGQGLVFGYQGAGGSVWFAERVDAPQ